MRKINVLSVFDGIGCGRIALDRLGVEVENYFSSEVDRYAIDVAQHNYPTIKQIGDISKIISCNLPRIDILMGGSPCQGFSFGGKLLAFDDPRSKLFFEFVRLKNELQPKYWLLENVVMKKEHEEIITKYLGVEPIKINSKLVSAQNRVRLYWTNINNIEQPQDKNINLVDILEMDAKQLNKATIVGRRLNEYGKREDNNKDIPRIQTLEVWSTNTNKSNCITTIDKDNVLTPLPIGRHQDVFRKKLPFRYYTLKEYCRLQTVPENYFDDVVSESRARKMLGNGWTVDVIAHILSFMK